MPSVELDIVFHVDSISEAGQIQLTERFEQAAQWVAKRFGRRRLTASISIVDDPTIARLNLQHLQHDWPTDVISFAFESGLETDGEIIASWDTASRLSSAAGWSEQDELLLYVLHGLLHLVGLDDLQPAQQREMRLVESQFVQWAGLCDAQTYLNRFDDVSY
jgi:probable rRNA maturation factor